MSSASTNFFGEEPLRDICQQLSDGNPTDPHYASWFVDTLLAAGLERGASDVHLLPSDEHLLVSWRIDGVLQPVGSFPAVARTGVVARLKVLSDLLTYRTDLPQEGRILSDHVDAEMRVSTFPTLYGEKAVIRIFASFSNQFSHLADLCLPSSIDESLRRLLRETSGAVLVVGPAGSGKTTTVYASMREILATSSGGRCVASLEDPIESVIPGAAQSQVNRTAGFDLATGLRSLMRQDPEVIVVGEIRDLEAAQIAFQAALTGQLMLTTFHAPHAAAAVSRLADMGIEPYVLRSGILSIVAQRLVRRLCECACQGSDERERLDLPVPQFRIPAGCDECNHTGYRGRIVLAEMLTLADQDLARAVLDQKDSGEIQRLATAHGMTSLWQRACEAVAAGLTSPAEIRRALGFTTLTPP